MASQAQRQLQTTRRAEHADLDAIVAVAIAALPADPVNPYRYPRWREFPDDYARFTRIRYAGWLADPNNVVMVCEVPASDVGVMTVSEEKETGSIAMTSGDKRIVAFSIWELPPSQRNSKQEGETRSDSATPTNNLPQSTSTERRDANPARVEKYAEEFSKAKSHFFQQPYGDKNLYLSILACHPAYQRRGIGKQLVNWGLDKAKQEGLDLTVFGSPMGSLLYRNVGFKEVGKFRVQVDGEEEFLDTLAMVLQHKDIA